MTRFIIVLVVWLALLNPAIIVGKSWQSHAVPGPVVEVQFPDGPVRGRMHYGLDGSTWLSEENGREHRLRGDEVVSSTVPVAAAEDDRVLWRSWRGITPIVALTCIFLVVGWMPRRQRQ
jgi:hypothetical protein